MVSCKGKGKGKQVTPEKPSPTKPQANPTTFHMDVTVQTVLSTFREPQWDLSEITHQVCMGLKAAKLPLTLLSGHWASYSNNFVFTFAGMVPFKDLLDVSDHLTQPFPSSCLVPMSGWSQVTFNGVPAFNPKSNEVYSSDHLLNEIKCNPLCSNLHFILHP
jgi:hypothetical protein